jgi:ABC-2 type transport system ATP-binding protein
LQPILTVDKLTKHYPKRKKPAIDNISFKVNHVNSRFYWTNGAGRATTFKCLIGAYAK